MFGLNQVGHIREQLITYLQNVDFFFVTQPDLFYSLTPTPSFYRVLTPWKGFPSFYLPFHPLFTHLSLCPITFFRHGVSFKCSKIRGNAWKWLEMVGNGSIIADETPIAIDGEWKYRLLNSFLPTLSSAAWLFIFLLFFFLSCSVLFMQVPFTIFFFFLSF